MVQMKHSISLDEAVELTSRYLANQIPGVPICETFDKASVLLMLSVPGAHSLRIYSGKKENGQVCAVICAANENGNDLLPSEGTEAKTDGEEEYMILEDGSRCPELCPPPSPLNP